MLENRNPSLRIYGDALVVNQTPDGYPLNVRARILKRTFDIALSTLGLLLFWWLIIATYIIATIDTKQNGFFLQKRVGKDGKLFHIIKIRTMRNLPNIQTTATTANDPRITWIGGLLRKTKLDELPQLLNILWGQMSFVGPRPDVPGFADQLSGVDRIIIKIRPGITGPATLAFRKEETLLADQSDPERYNREVIYPEKVRLNRQYIEEYSFFNDLRYLAQTVTGS